MCEIAADTRRDREIVAAHIDHEQREALAALALSEDRSVSSVLRRAIAAELERAGQQGRAA
jgi:predicted transcriptional regulator